MLKKIKKIKDDIGDDLDPEVLSEIVPSFFEEEDSTPGLYNKQWKMLSILTQMNAYFDFYQKFTCKTVH